METNIPNKIFLPIIISLMIGFVILDQAIKKIALLMLTASPVYLNDYFGLEIFKNSGIAFGLPISAGAFYFLFFLFIAWIASGKLLNFKEMRKKEILAVAFILCGALGNVIDRIRLGYIIDYMNFKGVVIFNLADVFIAIGIIILLENFFPDKGKGKFKKNVYILLFIFFGALIGFLIHAALEVWYIDLLILDFSRYSFGFSWPQLYIIHAIFTVVLFVGGLLFGYVQGRRWWKELYEKQ